MCRNAMDSALPFTRLCVIVGNGNSWAGERLLRRIAERLIHARAKHPVFAEGVYQGLGCITSEHAELTRAVERETLERQADEVLDVIATAVRFANREYEVAS